MKKVLSIAVACLFAVCFLGLTARPSESLKTKSSASTKTIHLKNACTFSIIEIYLSPPDDKHWGNNLLHQGEVLKPGATIDVVVDCGEWDARVVASDHHDCVVHHVKLCAADLWTIDTNCH